MAALATLLLGVAFQAGRALAASQVSLDIWVQVAPRPGLAVQQQLVVPGSVGAGSAVTWRILVTNAGAATVTGLTVTDTVAPSFVLAASDQPAGFTPVAVSAAAGSSLYAWSATGLTFSPGLTYTFTLAGDAGPVCAPAAVSSTGWVLGSALSGTTELVTGVAGYVDQPPTTSLAVAQTLTPAGPASGAPATYRLDVTNMGTATLTSLTVTDTLPVQVTTGVATSQPVPFPAPAAPAPAGASLYVWSASGLTFGPGTTLSFTVTGTVGLVGAPTAVSNSAFVVGSSACAGTTGAALQGFTLAPTVTLTDSLTVSSTTLSVGQPFLISLTVNNTGAGTATAVSPTLWVSSGGGAGWTGLPAPTSASIAPGANVVFTWTGTALSAAPGTVRFTATATAAQGPAPATNSPVVVIQTPPALAIAVATTPGGVCNGSVTNVSLTVTNTGQANAYNLLFDYFTTAGTAGFTPGVSTGLIPELDGGASFTVSRNYTATTAGTAVFSATVTGTDNNTGAAVSSGVGVSPVVTVNGSGSLAASLSATALTSSGEVSQVRLTVTNTGALTITGIAPSLAVTSGSLGAPTPPSMTLGTGASGTFTWIWTAGPAGSPAFSATVAGVSCGTSTAWDNLVVTTQTPASLSLTVLTPPASIVAQQPFVMTVTVTAAAGDADAVGVIPTLTPSVPALVALVSGPSPASANIAAGSSRLFVWTYSAEGSGGVSFTANAAGGDANSGSAVSAGSATSPSMTVQAAATLVVSLAAPGGVAMPAPVNATLNVQDGAAIGGAGLNVTSVNVSEFYPNANSLNARSAVLPATPVAVGAGVTTPFNWSYATGAPTTCGVAVVTAVVNASENGTGRILSATVSATVNVSGPVSAMLATATPQSGTVGTVSNVVFTVLDNCSPAVPAANVTVSVVVLSGNGAIVTPATGLTNGSGRLTTQLRLSNEAGPNVLKATAAGGTNPSATVEVDGTVPPDIRPYLGQNFFDPSRGQKLRLRIEVPAAMHVTARVFNLAGEQVRRVGDTLANAGLVDWQWDGRNDDGDFVGNGIYFVQIVTGGQSKILKVVVMRPR